MKQLQFDYWPILRSDDGTNPFVLKGQLEDLMFTHWNNKECWPTIELSKEGYVNGSVFRKCYIEFDSKHNILNLLTKQMIEHMRQQVLEYKRQFLASTG